MTDEIPLPPYQDVPGEVRDRLRDRVLGEISGWRRPRTDRRYTLAVAAAVAALVAAGLLVSHSIRDGVPATAPTATPSFLPMPAHVTGLSSVPELPLVQQQPISQPAAQPYLDRCWSAIVTAGKAAQYPAEATWQASFRMTEFISPNSATAGRSVVVAKAGNKPLFCETTPTSVSVSDPSVRTTGAATQVLMVSQDGVLAGITSSTKFLSFQVTTNGQSLAAGMQSRDGLWVAMGNPHGFQHSTVTLDGTQVATPAAGVFLVDRPQNGDRTSAAGQQLQSCLNTVTAQYGTLLDQASWQPGASVTSGSDHLVITTNHQAVAVCGAESQGEDGFFFAGPSGLEDPAVPIDMVYLDWDKGEILGLIGSNVGAVRVSAGSASVDATLVGGTFGALLPGGVPRGVQITYTVFDKQGHQIYSSTRPPGRPRG